MTVLAIDQGTSGTKAVVVSEDGAVLGIAEEPVRPTYLPGGGVEQDPAQLLSSVLTAGRRAIAASWRARDRGVVGQSGRNGAGLGSATPVHRSSPPWSGRTVAQKRCAAASPTPKTGSTSAPAWSWTATSQRPRCSGCAATPPRAGVVTTSDTWLVHQLTGEFVTDAATASRSLLTDLDTMAWDPELLDALRVVRRETTRHRLERRRRRHHRRLRRVGHRRRV